MPTRKVTIEDISQTTGLSRGTVSRALNDRPDISQKTKQKVLEACRTLNYVPSHAARSLATGRHLAVLTIVSDLADPLAAAVLRGVLASAEQQHYGVYLVELGNEATEAERRLRTISADRIDAALIATGLADEQVTLLRDALGTRRLASIAPLNGDACDCVGPDWVEAGRLAARQVLQTDGDGARVLVRGEDARFARGAREVLEAGGVNLDAALRVVDPSDEAALVSALDGGRAIATSCDRLAARLYPLCWRSGRSPGTDVLLYGCGNTELARHSQPGLSSIDLSGEEVGQRLMDLVLQRLGGTRQDGPQSIAVAPRLVSRASSGS